LNVLTLVGAPTSVPKFVNATPATVPLSAPVIVHVVVPPAGPFNVFAPAPPSSEIAMPAEPSEESMVNESLPSPPVTVRLEMDASAWEYEVPSMVTASVAPETDAEIVWSEPLDAVTVHAAGGASPLAVPVVESGAVASALQSADVALSVGVAGVVPTIVPPVESEEPPLPVVAPVAPCALGSLFPVTSAFVVVGAVDVTVSPTGSPVVVETAGPTTPASPVVPVTVEGVLVTVDVSVTVPVSVVPTTAVNC
jgi:hypothetical protein